MSVCFNHSAAYLKENNVATTKSVLDKRFFLRQMVDIHCH
jgi:hypothetical protein